MISAILDNLVCASGHFEAVDHDIVPIVDRRGRAKLGDCISNNICVCFPCEGIPGHHYTVIGIAEVLQNGAGELIIVISQAELT